MNSKKINWKEIWHSFAGKGYYIALILCAVAIGISGYLYYRFSGNPADPGGDVPAIATKPGGSMSTTVPTVNTPAPLKTGLPVSGQTVAQYAMEHLVYNPTTRDWRVHNGIDIVAQAGTPVCAAADGVVYTTYHDDALGHTVVVRHTGGYVTMYSSLDGELAVKTGDTVKLGQKLGQVGNSALLETAVGDHVHFCVTQNGQSLDPATFLKLG